MRPFVGNYNHAIQWIAKVEIGILEEHGAEVSEESLARLTSVQLLSLLTQASPRAIARDVLAALASNSPVL